MKRHRAKMLLTAAIIGLAAAAMGAWSALEVTRTVDVIGLFAGGFGAGAGFVAALHEWRGRTAGTARGRVLNADEAAAVPDESAR
jgi:hypothetical protein